MGRRIKTVQDVARWRMCAGCGACAYGCPNGAVELENIPSDGIRPRVDPSRCRQCGECLSFCVGYAVDAPPRGRHSRRPSAVEQEIGPVLDAFEGYACDPEIRHHGSSGGLLSALALYCLERKQAAFVLHSGMDPEKPWLNRTYQSRNKKDILARAGSRYAPASPCDSLELVEKSAGSCVFIGKPCDAAAVSTLSRRRPELAANVGVVLTHFCAGTPSTQGTLDLMESLGIAPGEVTSVRYRGQGWPGSFRVTSVEPCKDASVPYSEAWGQLYGYVPLRCRFCCHGLGHIGDISCGDAWHDFRDDGSDGQSVVLVRTERGRMLVRGAIEAAYVKLKPCDPASVVAGQTNLLDKRRHLFGRLLAMKLGLIPVTRFRGFHLFKAWTTLPLQEKWQSVRGTVSRIVNRRLWRPLQLDTRSGERNTDGRFVL